jgi:hypothetical protein
MAQRSKKKKNDPQPTAQKFTRQRRKEKGSAANYPPASFHLGGATQNKKMIVCGL